MPNEMADMKCTVVSFLPVPLDESKPGLMPPNFHIDACEDEKIPSILHVGVAYHHVYLGSDRTPQTLLQENAPWKIAASIVEDYVGSQLGINEFAAPGIFWVMGKLSAAEVMTQHKATCDAARKKQRAWYTELVRIADDDWSRYHRHNVVSNFQRNIALRLNLNPEQHPWMSLDTEVEQKNCPMCLSPVQDEAVICAVCKFVLNPEKKKAMAGAFAS